MEVDEGATTTEVDGEDATQNWANNVEPLTMFKLSTAAFLYSMEMVAEKVMRK